MKTTRQNKTKGFTLVEIGIVLLIAAAIIYAAIRLLGSKKEEAYALEDAQAIADMIIGIQKIYAVGGTITSNADLIASKTLPKHWTVSGAAISHRSGALNNFYTPTAYLPAGQIHVHMANIGSAEYCIALASTLAQNTNIGSIWAGNATNDNVRVGFVPLNYNALTTSCNNPGTRRVLFNFKTNAS